MNSNDPKNVDLISHRGVSTVYPENTLASYKHALKYKFKAIELDVVMSKDNTLFCSHNYELERETDGSGYINQLSDKRIMSSNAVNSSTGNKEKIPDLDSVLKFIPKDILLNIEVKSRKLVELGIAIHTVKTIQNNHRQDQTLISSFNPLLLKTIRFLSPKIKTGLIIKSRSAMLLYPISGADNIHPRADILDSHLIQYCRKRNIEIIPWTVNNSPSKNYLNEQGIKRMISDETKLLSSEP